MDLTDLSDVDLTFPWWNKGRRPDYGSKRGKSLFPLRDSAITLYTLQVRGCVALHTDQSATVPETLHKLFNISISGTIFKKLF